MAAGVEVALLVLDEVLGADGYRVLDRVDDGTRLDAGGCLLTVEAPTRGLLTAERTLLNLVCHLSGIATATAAWVDAVEGTNAQIRDTRKTLPGLRAAAEVRGAGRRRGQSPHGSRRRRADQGQPCRGRRIGGRRTARRSGRRPGCAVRGGGRHPRATRRGAGRGRRSWCCWTTFRSWQTQIAVQRRDSRSPATKLESSGGLSLETAAEYAGTGVDYLAVGALTHSVRVLDIGLDM